MRFLLGSISYSSPVEQGGGEILYLLLMNCSLVTLRTHFFCHSQDLEYWSHVTRLISFHIKFPFLRVNVDRFQIFALKINPSAFSHFSLTFLCKNHRVLSHTIWWMSLEFFCQNFFCNTSSFKINYFSFRNIIEFSAKYILSSFFFGLRCFEE